MSASNQKPVGSGFGAKSAAKDVMAGVDLAGKIAVVTGGHSGIGLETTRALVAAGANVVVPARDPDRAKSELAGNRIEASVAAMDLADLASVQEFAADIGDRFGHVDLLINNAGIMACPEGRVGPGWEMQFAVNHIGHFVLTNELTPYLKHAGAARVVCLSSIAHRRGGIIWDDIHFEKAPYDKWRAYAQAKTANALFALELNRRLSADGVKAFSVHPGGIMTPLQRHLPQEEMVALGWLNENGELSDAAKAMFKTPEQGCATTLWCATSPQLDERGGEYCEDCDIAMLVSEATPRWSGVEAWACDDDEAARLWTVTEEMVAAG